jgi:hypothetical protein
MLRLVAVLVAAGLLATGILSWRDRGRVAEMQASVAARKELAATRLAPAGSAPQAGVSARAPIRVGPIPAALAKRLRTEPDFQRFSHRCGVCHATPDPGLHAGAEWPNIVSRMSGTIDAAGLLPLGQADREAILRVLGEHSR